MPSLKGTEVSLFYAQCFLYLISSSINVSIFHITWLDTFWTDLLRTHIYKDIPINTYLSFSIIFRVLNFNILKELQSSFLLRKVKFKNSVL